MALRDHVDTRFNLQNALTALALAGGLVAWGMRMESRISVVEATQAAQKDVDKRQDAEKERAMASVEAKLDKLIDMHLKGRP